MREKINELSVNIKKNIDFLLLSYPNTQNILYQIDIILEHNADDDKIKIWLQNCKWAIDIINNLIERKNR